MGMATHPILRGACCASHTVGERLRELGACASRGRSSAASPSHRPIASSHPTATRTAAWAPPHRESRNRWLANASVLTQQQRSTFVKGLLLDVAGTLLSPSEKMTDVYTRYGAPYGVCLPEREMLRNFRRAYNEPWTRSPIRYVGDGKDFWHKIVSTATGCSDHAFFDEVYAYYGRAEAWKVAPGAEDALRSLRRLGVKLAIVSNFDTRLRPLLDDMQLSSLFDAVVVSAEVSAEKPNPVIFNRAVELLGLDPSDCVHVGDDRRNDLWGARDAGCHALLWGYDVKDMRGVVDWVIHGEHET